MEDNIDAWRARALASQNANAALQERVGALEAGLRMFYSFASSSAGKMRLCATSPPVAALVPVANPTDRDREYLAVLGRMRSAAHARMHQSMVVCCLDIVDFLGIRSHTFLRCVSKEMHVKMCNARASSWGVLQLSTFKEGDLRIKDMLDFLHGTSHAHVRVQVNEGLGVQGFRRGGNDLKNYRPLYGSESDLPHIESFGFVNSSRALLLQRDLPYRAELEVLTKMRNLKHLHFVRLSVPNGLLEALSDQCPHIETLSMIHCKGNQDNALSPDGSAMKDFQKLRNLCMDFHSHGAFGVWPGLGQKVLFQEVLGQLETVSVAGNMQDKITGVDYERMLARASKLTKLRVSRWPGCTATLEESLVALGAAKGVAVDFS